MAVVKLIASKNLCTETDLPSHDLYLPGLVRKSASSTDVQRIYQNTDTEFQEVRKLQRERM